MRAKIVNEDIKDIFKPKPELTEEYLDKMSIKDLIILVENIELVTLEGYGGENELGLIPKYVDKRFNKEAKILSRSDGHINTWDTYSLYEIPGLEFPKSVMRIRKTKTAGISVIFKIINYKKVTIIEHRPDYE